MADIDVNALRGLVNEAITQWAAGTSPTEAPTTSVEDKPKREDGKRVVRTKSTGDRVYVVDPNNKTKAWVTSPEVMEKLGFTMNDVEDIDDSELITYQMAPSIYKID